MFEPDADGEAWVMGREFLGREWLYRLKAEGLSLRLRSPLGTELQRGQRGHLRLRPAARARLFPAGLEARVVDSSESP